VSANSSDPGLSGLQRVRDLWQHNDLVTANGRFTAKVPRHGTVFVKIGTPKR
jgi:alpha-galactosidase